MRTPDVAIIGAGVMGAAAACELERNGVSVTLIDQASVPNPRAASIDHSKVFRFAYPDPLYVKLAVDALGRWRSLESETGGKLLTQTGALLIGKSRPSFETECYEAMRASGQQAEMLVGPEALARFPHFNAAAFDFGVYDPSGAILHAESAVRALLKHATILGARIIEGERVTEIKQVEGAGVSLSTASGNEIKCSRAMIAAGPWTRELPGLLADKLTSTRQEIVYFEPIAENPRLSFEPGSFPIFLELDSGFYGFPIHHSGAMKIANHRKGLQVDPYSTDDRVGEEFIEKCRDFFARYIPALANARVYETRMCMYNNTPDDDFIIDWHPGLEGVLVVSGFSGHGFKFGPTIGRIAAELLSSGQTTYDIERFSMARFNNRKVNS